MAIPKFQHVIGFGSACDVASGLSRLGLREHSGPFDWFMSTVSLNLTLMENHFEDFLNPDNLVHHPHPENNGEYFDQKYHLGFIHDFNPAQDAPPLSEQIDGVRAKYQRRIDYLYDCMKEPTLFVHSVAGHEADYINEHIDEIRARLRAFNPGNDIIFFSHYCEPENYPNVTIYKVGMHKNDHVLGLCYDDNKELHDILTSPETYPVEKRARNLDFFIKKQLRVNEDISMNEMRIAKERMEYENQYWAQWIEAQQKGRKMTDPLVADGVKKVALLGGNNFTRLLIPMLREVGITPVFIGGWHIDCEEIEGVPVRRPIRKPMPPEERKKFDEENERRAKNNLPPLKPPRRSFLLDTPGFEEIDAVIACQVEMAYFMTRDQKRGQLPCKLYTLSDLTGGEPVFIPPAEEE